MRLFALTLAVLLALAFADPTASADEKKAEGLAVGKPAPPFKLKNQDEKLVSNGELKGEWVVLYFYPKDDTPGCTVEACEFRDGIEALKGLHAKVVGVSPDSPESHRKFIEKYKLPFTLLCDPSKEMMTTYQAFGPVERDGKTTGRVIRSTVIIDPKGNVAKHYPKVTPKGHAAEIKKDLETLKKQG